MNNMKKMFVLMMIFSLFTFVGCVTTSGINNDANINENKLTRLSYVKKICQITDAYECEDFVVYELDNGKGRFVNDKKNKVKVCLIVKDGALYGRYSQTSKEGAVLAQSYHSDNCVSMPSYQNGYMYSYIVNSRTNGIIYEQMNRLARQWGLIEAIEEVKAENK